jgi:DNA-binding NarL/FixJ family response regulator
MKPSPSSHIPVFLVDDHPLVRQGLTALLEQAGFTVSGEADTPQATLAHPGLSATHVVLLDLTLEQANGLDLIPLLCQRGLRVVVYSMHEDGGIVRRALQSGAHGYVTKRETAQSLPEAIRVVAGGGSFISPRASDQLARQASFPDLSRQQQRLYDLLGQGFDAEEIAAALQVGPRTVETYCTRLMDKLGVSGMKELRLRAIADHQRHIV